MGNDVIKRYRCQSQSHIAIEISKSFFTKYPKKKKKSSLTTHLLLCTMGVFRKAMSLDLLVSDFGATFNDEADHSTLTAEFEVKSKE